MGSKSSCYEKRAEHTEEKVQVTQIFKIDAPSYGAHEKVESIKPRVDKDSLFACQIRFREERDTFGPLNVPVDRYWGA